MRSFPGTRAHPAAAMAGARTAGPWPSAAEPPLDHISFVLTRAYYNYLGLLEGVLAETRVGKHVHPGMGHILFSLFAEDDLTLKDLVERGRLSYATLSGMVARMKRAKRIACRRDAGDGRLVRIRLTPLGKSLETRCRAVLSTIDEVMRAGISQEHLLIARSILQQMTVAMRAYDMRRRGKKEDESEGVVQRGVNSAAAPRTGDGYVTNGNIIEGRTKGVEWVMGTQKPWHPGDPGPAVLMAGAFPEDEDKPGPNRRSGASPAD